jgi:hypothetical protein
MARLSRGEFVIPAHIVKTFSPNFFEGIRTGAISPEQIMSNVTGSLPQVVKTPAVPKFSAGGFVNPQQQQQPQQPNVEVVNANFVDPALFANFLATQEGKKLVFNVLRDEPEQVKRILAT